MLESANLKDDKFESDTITSKLLFLAGKAENAHRMYKEITEYSDLDHPVGFRESLYLESQIVSSIPNDAELKEIHRERRVNFSEAFSLRIHRGLSWVQRAEKEINDPDASFIFYWIAFNSIYADIDAKEGPEKSKFNNFFNLLFIVVVVSF